MYNEWMKREIKTNLIIIVTHSWTCLECACLSSFVNLSISQLIIFNWSLVNRTRVQMFTKKNVEFISCLVAIHCYILMSKYNITMTFSILFSFHLTSVNCHCYSSWLLIYRFKYSPRLNSFHDRIHQYGIFIIIILLATTLHVIIISLINR
jgi:hypothetical protein